MKKKLRNKQSKINSWSSLVPVISIIVISLSFFYSGFYEPSWSFKWDGIRPEIRDTIQAIECYGSISSGIVGYTGKRPQQFERRMWLMKNASNEELTRLKDFPNGIIKTIAFEALVTQQTVNRYNLLVEAFNDSTSFFNYQSGCIGERMMVGEYLVEKVANLSEKGLLPKHYFNRLKLTSVEQEQILQLYNKQKFQKWEYYESQHNYKH